ncbi:hypothetical protein FJZ28_01205 [Candidatus Peregrinibacteria bacterium]|nr:hypothetical protein [Candidatus Peregrinibacteria bacterium]
MANRQLYVVGALGLLMGMVVGAGSGQSAQTVSQYDPNSDAVQEMDSPYRADGYLRFRSTDGTVGDEGGIVTRSTPPRRLSRMEMAARRLQNMHSAARTSGTVRGARTRTRNTVPECAGYTRDRYTRCLESVINGEEFVPNYFPIEYEEE